MKKSFETLEAAIDSRGVLNVTLTRPDVRNAFNGRMIQELTDVFEGQAKSPEVKLIVLQGAGKVFCAGGDLNWMRESVELDYAGNLRDTKALSRMFTLMNECEKPLIGKIHGAAIGGGVGLVSVCDIAFATEDTKFSLSEVRLGLIPACIGPFVVSKVGASHARRFFISAERFTGRQAEAIGLIHQTFSSSEALETAVNELVTNMLQCGPGAVKAAKELVLNLAWPEKRARLGDPTEYCSKCLAELRVSDEGQEGVHAFLEKRKPAWLNG